MSDNGKPPEQKRTYQVPLEVAPMLFMLNAVFCMLNAETLPEGEERDNELKEGRSMKGKSLMAAEALSQQIQRAGPAVLKGPDGQPIDLSQLKGQ